MRLKIFDIIVSNAQKKITKRLPKGPADEQKIILDDKSKIKFYNPDFRREIF